MPAILCLEDRQPVIARFAFIASMALAVAACGPNYSPDTYASSAVQQASKVDKGVVIGVREVQVTSSGTAGAVAGGAAGGIAGAQVGTGAVSALSALGGSLIGGLAGAATEKVTSETKAFEYIIRKPNGDLVSVTQKDETALKIGTTVLVIAGTQARVVPDYTVGEQVATAGKPADPTPPAAPQAPPAPPATTTTAAPAAPSATVQASPMAPIDLRAPLAESPPAPKADPQL